MKKVIFLKCFMAIVAIFLSTQAFALTHVVTKGETIESIAQKYGTSTQVIIQANPDAASFIYVGMELNIPQGNSVTVPQSNTSPVQGETSNQYDNSSQITTTSFQEDARWAMWGGADYGFLSHGGCFSTKLGVNYWTNTTADNCLGFFAGAGLGYFWASYEIDSITLSSQFITIPLHIGYAVPISNSITLVPKAGLDINCCFDANLEGGGNTAEFTKETGLIGRLGASIRISDIELNFSYNLPMNDDQKLYTTDDGYFSVGIGYGF